MNRKKWSSQEKPKKRKKSLKVPALLLLEGFWQFCKLCLLLLLSYFQLFYLHTRCQTNHCHCLPASFFLPLLPFSGYLLLLLRMTATAKQTTYQKRSQFKWFGISTLNLCSLWIYSWCFTADNTIFPWVSNSQNLHGVFSPNIVFLEWLWGVRLTRQRS